jgi:modulator of FtsH protease HflK
MSKWNIQRKEGNGQDPWTGKPRPQKPPELEEIFRNFSRRLIALLMPMKGTANTGGRGTPEHKHMVVIIFGFIATLLFLIWLLMGLFIVGPAEKAVILRFGRYVSMVGPGPHWIPRFIESSETVNIQKVSTYSYESQMLTKDANIVSVALAIQYRVIDPKEFFYNIVAPRESLQQATASALRQVIGRTSLDSVLTLGRDQVRQEVRVELESILARYHAGLLITDVALQSAKAPEEVKEAFDDAIKAQEDEQKIENQAQAYAMQVEPTAKGQAQRLLADAQAYKQQVVLQAKGETAQYMAMLPQYQAAPTITRTRLYMDAMQSVFQHTRKVLVNIAGSNNVFYIPLDKMMNRENSSEVSASNNALSGDSKIDASNPSGANTLNLNSSNDKNNQGGY